MAGWYVPSTFSIILPYIWLWGIFPLILDADHFYVLEDWVIDKTKGNGVTGWVNGCHSYQREMIHALEALVK